MKVGISILKELDHVIKIYDIDRNDMLIVGSYPLQIKDIRTSNDIDIVISDKYRKELEIKNDESAINLSNCVELVSKGWANKLGINDDELIYSNKYFEFYKGFKVVSLEVVIRKKIIDQRVKDLYDLNILYKKGYSGYKITKSMIIRKKINYKILWMLKKIKKITKYGLKILKKPNRIFKNNKICSLDKYIENFNISIDPVVLMSLQYHKKEFMRYDVLIRMQAFENYYEEKPDPFNLYDKMQLQRKQFNHDSDRYKQLIASIAHNGFDVCNNPISVNKIGKLLDGSHRLAITLKLNQRQLSVSLKNNDDKIDYGRKWFENKSFSKKEIKEVDDYKHKIFIEKGIYFPIILWPAASSSFNRIFSEINKEYPIVKSHEINFTPKSFQDFVFDIYSTDDIENWKVKKKLYYMITFKKNIKIAWIDLGNPYYRKKHNNELISTKGEKLKKHIRNKFKNEIDNYTYDIIFHTGDNSRQNVLINEIIEKYKSL